jgi:bifunctional non-homologous end joining protein LigD
MVRAAPDRFTVSAAKRRRRGRIFIDYLRNDRGATAIASYSPRARAGAPVALPIDWDELASARTAPLRFGLREVPALLAARSDPWAAFEEARRTLAD